MFRFAAISLYLLLTYALPGQDTRITEPPSTIPASCGSSLIGLSGIAGTHNYMRLRYEVKALEVALRSRDEVQKAIKEVKSKESPTVAISGFLSEMNQANDSLLCAAFVIGQSSSTSEDERTIRTMLISVFNREADAVIDMKTLVKDQFSRSTTQQTNIEVVNDAERLSAINALQHEAAEDLLQTTAFSLGLSIDLQDPKATTTKYITLTCKERTELLGSVVSAKKVEKNAYTDPLQLMQGFLIDHQCKR